MDSNECEGGRIAMNGIGVDRVIGHFSLAASPDAQDLPWGAMNDRLEVVEDFFRCYQLRQLRWSDCWQLNGFFSIWLRALSFPVAWRGARRSQFRSLSGVGWFVCSFSLARQH